MSLLRTLLNSSDAVSALERHLVDAKRIAEDELKLLFTRKMLADLAQALPSPSLSRTRTALFRAAGVQIGERSHIQGPMRLTGIGNPCSLLSIGANTMITGTLHIDLGARVRIGDWVRIGHDVSLLTVSHAVGPWYLRAGTSFFG